METTTTSKIGVTRTRNTVLLRIVADKSEADPYSYDQGVWVSIADDPTGDPGHVHDAYKAGQDIDTSIVSGAFSLAEMAATRGCGTTACVAGHAVLESHDAPELIGTTDESVRTVAAKLLGIQGEMAEWFFSTSRDERAMPTLLRACADGADLDALKTIEWEGV